MSYLLLALTEAERTALVAAIATVVAAAVPASIAAWNSHKTRKENTDQHGQSQKLLQELSDGVKEHGQKLDKVADRVEDVARRVDHAHERIDHHPEMRDY
jgi:peptidoglycan hydrolase CwlO-like protein